MTNSQPDRLDRMEALLESFIVASSSDRQASNERMTRIEERLDESTKASDERMTRIEQSMAASNERMTRVESGLERLEQATRSNNRFLESFSTDIRRYVDTMNNLATRMDGMIATANQDRQETNSRLGAIQRQVSAIARHLGVI